MPERFGYADVGTFGLAHSLLAWARCRLWCDANAVPMLAPNWMHLQHRIGPLIRRERDNRQYHRLFHFPGYIVGWRRQYLLLTLKRVPAETASSNAGLRNGGKHIVVFSNRMSLNEETYFHEIVGHNERIRSALETITKPKFRPPTLGYSHVAIHIRLGDFGHIRSLEALRKGPKNARLPVTWYCDVLQTIRKAVGDIAARVYSDGSDRELIPLLSMPGVVRSTEQSSITDLLSIAQARLLISSGSGFSMWGAYLGAVPRVCFPGQRFVRVLGEPCGVDLEPECAAPKDLDERFLHLIWKMFS